MQDSTLKHVSRRFDSAIDEKRRPNLIFFDTQLNVLQLLNNISNEFYNISEMDTKLWL